MDHAFLAILVVGLAFIFNFTNGFHDAANQVATVISSRALSPELALTLAAAADFAGAYFLGGRVARMIGTGLVDPELVRHSAIGIQVLIGALTGAIAWNLATWYFGLPASSSHALIGGLLGAFLAGFGRASIQWKNVGTIFGVMVASPLVGFALTYGVAKILFFAGQWLTPRAHQTFKALQTLSMIFQAVSHGSNDVPKSVGVITLALGFLTGTGFPHGAGAFQAPHWVVACCALIMSAGILTGGWRIIRTLGGGLYKVRPIHAFSSQSAAALIMSSASYFGYPLSTTQVISSSVMGAGAAFRFKSVRWTVAGDMLLAWLVTIPASGFLSAGVVWAMLALEGGK